MSEQTPDQRLGQVVPIADQRVGELSYIDEQQGMKTVNPYTLRTTIGWTVYNPRGEPVWSFGDEHPPSSGAKVLIVGTGVEAGEASELVVRTHALKAAVNGPAWLDSPRTHRAIAPTVYGFATASRTSVRTAAGDRTAEVGDYIIGAGTGDAPLVVPRDVFEALYQPLGESDEPIDAEFADEDEGPWWRISLMGHRTVVSRIESETLHGLPMWRLRDEGGELINPATAVFSAEPWDDVRPLKGLPEGVRAHRSPHTRGEWFVAGFGRSWHVRLGEAELRDRLAALPALVARWSRLPRSIRFRLYQSVDAVPELDTIRQLVELGEREEVNESLARGDSLLAQVADHGPGDTHGASLETELGLPDADERELADHDAQDPSDDKIPF